MVPSKFGNQLELIQLSLTSSGQHQAIRYRQSIERSNVIPGFPKQLRTSRWRSQSSCVSLKAIPYSVRCSTGPFTGVSEIKTLYLRDLSGIRLCTKDSVSPHRHQFHLQTDWVITVHSVRGEVAISLLQRVRVLHVINTNTPLIHPELYAPIWSRIARCRRGTRSQRGSQ